LTEAQATRSVPEPIREEPASLEVPVLLNRDWATRHPRLVQGITWRGPAGDFDLGLFGAGPVGATLARWRDLQAALGFKGCVHARQVHGTRIVSHETSHDGLLVIDAADGHATGAAGLLLTVSVADCIPIAFADPSNRRIAIVHAGWRGVATGAAEAAIATLARSGSAAADLLCHLGPAICGACYEVGPEVHERLGLDRPARNQTVDLREVARRRVVAAGVPASATTVSGLCPRCEADRFFSHRAGAVGRQMGFIGIRFQSID
jgi:purine-nucleoside/S-methyl-5'-thioadenosine phosphorylase / adenosine deaminase